MKKLMVYLDDELHEDLRELAHRKRTTMAALIRYSLDKTFEDELDEISSLRSLDEYLRDPSSAITLEEYAKRRGIVLQDRHDDAGAAGSQRIAEGRGSYRAHQDRKAQR